MGGVSDGASCILLYHAKCHLVPLLHAELRPLLCWPPYGISRYSSLFPHLPECWRGMCQVIPTLQGKCCCAPNAGYTSCLESGHQCLIMLRKNDFSLCLFCYITVMKTQVIVIPLTSLPSDFQLSACYVTVIGRWAGCCFDGQSVRPPIPALNLFFSVVIAR